MKNDMIKFTWVFISLINFGAFLCVLFYPDMENIPVSMPVYVIGLLVWMWLTMVAHIIIDNRLCGSEDE